jgi:alkylhydroperoxidase family enzyme
MAHGVNLAMSTRMIPYSLLSTFNSLGSAATVAYIRQISDEEADGTLARVFEAARGRHGRVANIIRVMSLDARSVQGSMQFYVSLMKSPNALDAARREMLAAVVSNINDCYY